MDRAGSRTGKLLAGGCLLALLGLVACIAWESRYQPDVAGPIHLVFRFDDYSQRGQENVQEGVLEAFRRHGMPVTVAAIPCPADSWTPAAQEPCRNAMEGSRVRTLVDAHRDGVAEIALHGFQHIDAGNRPFESEFHGVAPAEQRARIARGLDELEAKTGVRPVSFVPPFDAYDAATLRVVEDLGMRAFSGWLQGTPSSGEELAFVPNSVHVLRVREVVERLNLHPDPGAVLVTIFHPWDLVEANEMEMLSDDTERPLSFARLDALLAWLAERPEVNVTTMKALAESEVDVSEARFAISQQHSRSKLWPLLPPPLSGAPHEALHTPEHYRQLAVSAWLRVGVYTVAVLALLGAAVSVGLRWLLRRGLPRIVAVAGILVGTAALLVAPWVMDDLGWKDFAVLLMAAGAALGSALALRDGVDVDTAGVPAAERSAAEESAA